VPSVVMITRTFDILARKRGNVRESGWLYHENGLLAG